jgi:hypothetical protein
LLPAINTHTFASPELAVGLKWLRETRRRRSALQRKILLRAEYWESSVDSTRTMKV